MRAGSRTVARVLTLVAGTVAVLTLTSTAAEAHAVLEATNPQAGTEIEQLPAQITLSFGEDVTINDRSLQVVSPDGSRVDARSVHHPAGIGSQVAVAIPATLPQGSYTVVWRVVSADSHPVAGTFTFGYGVPAGESVPAPHGSRAVGLLDGTARFLGYLGIVLVTGALGFVALVWPGAWQRRRVRVQALAGLGTLSVSSVALLLLSGPYDAGVAAGRVFDGRLLSATLDTKFGRLVALRAAIALAGLVLLATSRGVRSSRLRPDLVTITLVALLTFSLSEHAGTGRQAPLAAAADTIHLASVGLWVGGLVTVLLLLTRPDIHLLPDILGRWSNLALGAVVLIVVTGAYASWRELGTFPAFPDTPYGRLLLAKIGLLALLVTLGAFGRRRIRRPSPDSSSARTLRRSVGAEVALSVGVLAVAAVLVDVQPGRDTYDPAHTVNVTASGTGSEQLRTRIHVDTTRPGPTDYTIELRTHDGRSQPFQEINGLLTEPAKGLGPVRFSVPASSSGIASAERVIIPTSGHWQLELQIRTDATTGFVASTTYAVR